MFADEFECMKGNQDTAGEQSADEGITGDSTGAHLHFERHTGPWSSDNASDPQPLYEAAAEPGSG